MTQGPWGWGPPHLRCYTQTDGPAQPLPVRPTVDDHSESQPEGPENQPDRSDVTAHTHRDSDSESTLDPAGVAAGASYECR